MFGNGGDPGACIGDVRADLPSNRPTGVFLAKWSGDNVIVFPVFDPAPRVVVGIPYVSKRREENEGDIPYLFSWDVALITPNFPEN